ncbi:lipopolysaccharide biosynthesis protein [Rhodococcus sp. NPDC019627]|uniref:lipopolysaccharide biosynthesis protein n=1 Tax=unclassified Rhodococcus (in: high G+C Gram-positive bacteria) TaxID=192944 RepID=UPI0033C6DFDB
MGDYAQYIVATAIWAIANAALGVGVGLRISHDAANGAGTFAFTNRELVRLTIGMLICGVLFLDVSGDPIRSVCVAATLLSFVACEAAISHEVGGRRFGSFFIIFSLRSILPVVLIGLFACFHEPTFDAAVVSILVGNMAGMCVVATKFRWKQAVGSSVSSGPVSAISLGVWLLASADKIILERTSDLVLLGSYALVYGLLDRVFRALQNAYTAKHVGEAFSGSAKKSSIGLGAASLGLALVLAPVSVFLCRIISGGRYEPSIIMSTIVSLSLAIMFISAPYYLSMLALKSYSVPTVVIYAIAAVNVVGNVILTPNFGTMASAILTFASYIAWLVFLFAWFFVHSSKRRNSVPSERVLVE